MRLSERGGEKVREGNSKTSFACETGLPLLLSCNSGDGASPKISYLSLMLPPKSRTQRYSLRVLGLFTIVEVSVVPTDTNVGEALGVEGLVG